jgi:transposase
MEAKFADLPDLLWEKIEPLLPPERPKPRGGRPRVADRVVMAGIVYRLKTGCQWKALPDEFGSGSTCHLRLHQWCQAGVFEKIFAELLRFYDSRRGIKWQWSSLDSAMVKSPKGGTSRVPTRRTVQNKGSNATS